MLRRDTEKTVWRSRNYPLSQTNSFCLQEESHSNLLASTCLQCFTKIISLFRLLSMSSQIQFWAPEHPHQIPRNGWKSHLNKSSWSTTRPGSSKVALTDIHCCGTHSSRQQHEQLCIHVLALCLHARLSYTHVLSFYLYLCLLPPAPFICVCPALRLTILQCPPTLISLKLENSTLH